MSLEKITITKFFYKEFALKRQERSENHPESDREAAENEGQERSRGDRPEKRRKTEREIERGR